MTTPILEVRSLRKSFRNLVAVDSVSLSVLPGECLGLLGPNGAGKTTTLSMLAGLLTPDQGEVLIEGRPLSADDDPLKAQLGLVPQEIALYDELTARENLRFFGALYNLRPPALDSSMAGALKIVGLSDRAQDKVKNFSGGMKRRLNLAAALLHDPKLLLLDEPTVGVDPQSRNAIFDNINSLRAAGKTILYTTHYMEEVERLCDRVVIMDHGKVIADDTMAGLKDRAGAGNRILIELAPQAGHDWLPALRKINGVIAADLQGTRLAVQVTTLGATSAAVMGFLHEAQVGITQISSGRPNLESIFLSLTGNQLRDL